MQSKMFTLPKRSQSPKLYFLHGFAGGPEDWDEVIAHLPGYNCTALTYPFDLPTEGILIGYSMGGRIAMHSPRPKIVISSHPGLSAPDEQKTRSKKEQAWIHKLKTTSITQFFNAWYRQPIFSTLRDHPSFPDILKRRLKQHPDTLIKQIQNHSLAEPAPLVRNTIFVHGALDHRYKQLYSTLNIPSHEIPRVGHACHLEGPVATARIIKYLIDSLIN